MAKAQPKIEPAFEPEIQRESRSYPDVSMPRGGPVAELQAQIAERLNQDSAPRVLDEAGLVAFWEMDQRPSDQAIALVSRAVGIAALVCGFAAVGIAIFG